MQALPSRTEPSEHYLPVRAGMASALIPMPQASQSWGAVPNAPEAGPIFVCLLRPTNLSAVLLPITPEAGPGVTVLGRCPYRT